MSAPLDEKALDAAHNLIWPATEWNDGEHACRETVRAAIRAYLAASNVNEPPKAEHVCGDALSSVPTDKLEVVASRDIWECANQLYGYIDTSTPDNLASFLRREGDAAADLAHIIREQAERIAELERERDAYRAQISQYQGMVERKSNEKVEAYRLAESLRADRDRMKAALEKLVEGKEIADPNDNHGSTIMDYWSDEEVEAIARAALNGGAEK